jgi:hypothetical protein
MRVLSRVELDDATAQTLGIAPACVIYVVSGLARMRWGSGTRALDRRFAQMRVPLRQVAICFARYTLLRSSRKPHIKNS